MIVEQLFIKVLPEALEAANALAVQLGDSPEGVDSFNDSNAFNKSGLRSDPIEFYAIDPYAYEANAERVRGAVELVDGIEIYESFGKAVGKMKRLSPVIPEEN